MVRFLILVNNLILVKINYSVSFLGLSYHAYIVLLRLNVDSFKPRPPPTILCDSCFRTFRSRLGLHNHLCHSYHRGQRERERMLIPKLGCERYRRFKLFSGLVFFAKVFKPRNIRNYSCLSCCDQKIVLLELFLFDYKFHM